MAYAADTSVVVPAVDDAHAFHGIALRSTTTLRPVVAGHAAFEAFSVLTRRPPPHRVSPVTAAELLHDNFGEPAWITDRGSERVYRLLGEGRIVGGAVYDAMVAQAALDNDRTLLTLDRRAARTYDLLGVTYELIG